MLSRRRRPQVRIGRNIIYAIVLTTIISMTAAGSSTAAFSFLDPVRSFFGFETQAAAPVVPPPCSLVVSTNLDGPVGSGSLRSAIICANLTPGADVITLPAGTYMLTLTGPGEDAAATGDLDITEGLTINGAGAATTIINGAQSDRVFEVRGPITVALNGLTMTNGQAVDCAPYPGLGSCGGAILNNGGLAEVAGVLNITNSVISNSSTTGGAADGGAIFDTGTNGTINVTNTTISGNSTYYGGAISGGGTYTIVGSTITGNYAGFYGGGIYTSGPLTIINSTFSGNGAGNSGGAILSFTSVNIYYSTINGNAGSAAVHNYGGTATIQTTIIANQQTGTDCAGAIASNSYNLESGTSCGFTNPDDLQNTNPLLGGLQNNGGPTYTHALLNGSPAVDKVPFGIHGCGTTIPTDQRGYSRPGGTHCDMGSFEFAAQGTPTPTPSPVCVPPPPNMVAWWPGDNSGEDLIGPYDGELLNGAAYAPGMVANGFQFFGGDSVVRVPDAPTWDFGTGEFTIDTWVKLNTQATGPEQLGSQALVAHDDGGGSNNKWIFWFSDGQLQIHYNNTSGQAVYIGVAFVPVSENWYHVAVTRSGAIYKFYVNGAQIGEDQFDQYLVPDANAPLTVGKAEQIASTIGQIDEVEIFHRALTASELAAIYNAGSAGKCKNGATPTPTATPTATPTVVPTITPSPTCVPPPPDMLGWWPGDGNANDIQSGHNGTLSGSAGFDAGLVGQAFSFNGTPGHVLATGTTNIDGGPQATYDAWVYPTAVPNVGEYFGIVGVGDSTIPTWTTQQCRVLYWNQPGNPTGTRLETAQAKFYADCGLDNNENRIGRISTQDYPINTWHFVTMVFNNGSLDLYVDGVLDNGTLTGTGGTSINTNAYNYLWIGGMVRNDSTDSWVNFNGRIDEVEVFDRALAPTEISTIYNAGSAGKCKTGCTPPPPEMIGWWPGDGNPNDIIGGNNGTLIGDATYATGMVQQGFSLDGYDDFVDLNIPNVNTSEGADITVDFWMYWNGQSTYEFGQMPFGFHRYDLYFYGPGFGFNTGNSEVWGIPSEGLANRWVHVAGIFHNGNITQSRLFIDGVERQLSAQWGEPGIGNVTTDARIGGWLYDNDYDFYGRVDEVEVFNRVLTPEEIFAIYSAGSAGKCKTGCTPPPPNMVSWYRAENNVIDTISGFDGTLYNGTTYAAGKVGQAFSFDGVDDYVAIPHHPAQNTGAQITIDAWVYRNSPRVGATIFQKRSPANVGGYVFEVTGQDDRQLQFVLMIDGTYHFATSPPVLTVGTWQHVAATYDGQMMRIYVDGNEVIGVPQSGTVDPTEDPVVIGRNEVYHGFAWDGKIDEVELFNRALSRSEILAIYNAGSAGKCLPSQTPTPTPSATPTPVEGADLAISKTDGVTNVTPGGQTTYTIVVTNNGPSPVVDAVVTDIFAPGVTVTNWTCLPQNWALCTLAGAGNINDTVYLPPGGTLTYTALATTSLGMTGTLVNTATVTPPATINDPNLDNNTATDTDHFVISITGNVKHYGHDGNTNLAGVTMNIAGTDSGTTTTDAAGNYTFANLTSGGTWTVTPSMANEVFDPLTRSVSGATANVAGVDFLAYDWDTNWRNVWVENTHAIAGNSVLVPIKMGAMGGETVATFSLEYPTTILNTPILTCGESTPGCVITTVPGLPGTLGVTVTAPTHLEEGLREIANVRFSTNAGPGAANAPVAFVEEPVACALRDQANNEIPAWWLTGFVVFDNGLESDVANRKSGDGTVMATDVTQVRRFVAGLDPIDPAYNEFQRADSAPQAFRGDGELLPGDVIQARRYATGLDTPVAADGPVGPLAAAPERAAAPNDEAAKTARVIRAGTAFADPGGTVSVAIELLPQGGEAAAGFTVDFDATRLTNARVALGGNVTEAAVLTVNMNEAADGRIGVLVDSPDRLARDSAAAPLVTITFDIAKNAEGGEVPIAFTDRLARRGLSDELGNTLDARFVNGAVYISGPESTGVEVGGRVTTQNGRGIPNAIVTMGDGNGNLRTVVTGTFGYYRFGRVLPGHTYGFRVLSRRFRFTPQRVLITEPRRDIDFVAID